jgi:hypothetical protein
MHSDYRVSTAGALRAIGHELFLTNPTRKHYSLFFDTIPTQEEFDLLAAAFGPPVHNPP